MIQKFNVKVNESHDFEIDSDTIKDLDVVAMNDHSFHLLKDSKPYTIQITNHDFNNKSYQVKVNNNSYSIKIEDQLDALIKSMGFEVGTSKKVDNIKAPMPGLILDIMVKSGDKVQLDSPLLILEAMKMENIILSPREGIVKSVSSTKGNTVDKGELLIEFE